MVRRTVVLVGVAGLAASASGQAFSWLTAASGPWTTAANWDLMAVPNGVGDTATLGLEGAYTVTLTGGVIVDALTISNPAATLEVTPGSFIGVAGTLGNEGVVKVNTANTPSGTSLRFDVSGGFTGTGAVLLDGDGSRAQISRLTGSVLVSNGSGHAILGSGLISSGLTNDGAVRADLPGRTLELNGAAVVNNGELSSTNGGRLLIQGITVEQGGGGSIFGLGGDVDLVNARVNGGDLSVTSGGPSLDFMGLCTLDGAMLLSDALVPAGNTLLILNGLDHVGVLEVNRGDVVAGTTLRFDSTGSLTGSGTVRLAGQSSRAQIGRLNGGVAVTNGAAHTIEGFGLISSGMTNEGLIRANVDGQTLVIQSANVVNNAEMRSEGGAVLHVTGITVTQGVDGVIEATGGEVDLTNATVVGGAVRSTGASRVDFVGSPALDAAAFDGNGLVTPGSALVVRNGLVNSGTLVVNGDDSVATTTVRFDTTGSLSGGGTLRLAGLANRAQVTRLNGTVVATNGADHTIEGFGQVAAGLVNEGLLRANTPGRTLNFTGAAMINNGLASALDGAVLRFESIDLAQGPGGVVRAEDGGDLTLFNADVAGGRIEALPGSNARISGLCVLDGTVLEGDATLTAGSTVQVFGGLEHTGVLGVNPDNEVAVTTVRFDESGSMTGGGTLRLAGLASRAQITRLNGGVVVTNEATHQVRGFGQVVSGLVNEGVVAADVPGQTLTLATADVTNTNELRVEGGATLDIVGITVDQTGGGEIVADAGTVRVINATIIGGFGTGGASATFVVSGASTFTSFGNRAETQIGPGSVLFINGGLENEGMITVNPGNEVAVTTVRFDSDATLTGPGTLRLDGPTSRAQVTRLNSTVDVANGAGHTIEGVGQIATPLTNHGRLAPGSGGAGTMTATFPIAMTGTALLDVEIGGTAAGAFDALASTSTVDLSGTIEIERVSGFAPVTPTAVAVLTTAPNGLTGRFDTIVGEQPTPPLVLKVAIGTDRVEVGYTCPADVAVPLTQLNVNDIIDFVNGFNGGLLQVADISPFPAGDGLLNVNDIVDFVNGFNAGCP